LAARKRIRVLGTTRVDNALGKGGMAEIFHGTQAPLGRAVAVKVMLPKIASDRDMAKRFHREARTLAALQHENIIGVYDLVVKNRQTFMILEYVDGEDVSELIREAKRLPTDIALIVALGVARALEHAHFRRVIHRDIKPANVMVSRRGEVKLGDFGIAKDVGDRDLTRTGFVVGTPSYLPPELLKGERADLRGDLWAVGVLLFECLTGQKPFRGATPQELVAAILAGQRERVRTLAAECPREVEKIVDACLEVDLAKRYQRAADLRRDVEAQLRELRVPNPSARMVAYLYARGLSRVEDLATLDVGELKAADPTLDLSTAEIEVLSKAADDLLDIPIDVATLKTSRRWPRRVLASVLVAVAACGVLYAIEPTKTTSVVRAAITRITSIQR
jgi:serine/threonine protein kinase